jgi:hypothetical protein
MHILFAGAVVVGTGKHDKLNGVESLLRTADNKFFKIFGLQLLESRLFCVGQKKNRL